jgi:hypothetical protein
MVYSLVFVPFSYSLYFILTKGIFRSLWSVRMLTYHGASAIALSVLDWNLWMRLHILTVIRIKSDTTTWNTTSLWPYEIYYFLNTFQPTASTNNPQNARHIAVSLSFYGTQKFRAIFTRPYLEPVKLSPKQLARSFKVSFNNILLSKPSGPFRFLFQFIVK